MNCDICLTSKQTRLQFKTEISRADRTSTDNPYRPIDPLIWNGKKYVLIVLDDYSHFTMVYYLETKNEVLVWWQSFFRLFILLELLGIAKE